MSLYFKKNMKVLYSKKKDNSFFQEYSDKQTKILNSKTNKLGIKTQASSIKTKFYKSQSFSKISFDNNLNINSNRHILNRTINSAEPEINIRNLINSSVEKVDKVIKKHSSKSQYKSKVVNPISHTKHSSLVIIEEREEDIAYRKTFNKISLVNKNNDKKKIHQNKKVVVTKTSKNSLTKQPLPKLTNAIEIKEKKQYDFLLGFKDKLNIFLKNKNKKNNNIPSINYMKNSALSPLIRNKKVYPKSLSNTPVPNIINYRSFEFNMNKNTQKLLNRTMKQGIKKKFDTNSLNQQKHDHTLNENTVRKTKYNIMNYYTTVNSPNGDVAGYNRISKSKGKSSISPLYTKNSVSPSRNMHTLFRNKTSCNISRREIIPSSLVLQRPTPLNPLNSLLTKNINFKMVNLANILEFIIIYKDINRAGITDNLTTLIYHLKNVLEDQDVQPKSNSSSSLLNLNTDISKNLIIIDKEKEIKAKLIQRRWREYKVKKILNVDYLNKDNVNEICRDYLINQLLNNSQNFSFLTELFSLTLNLWEEIQKIQYFSETKNNIINIKNCWNYSDITSNFLSNIIKLRQAQSENISESQH